MGVSIDAIVAYGVDLGEDAGEYFGVIGEEDFDFEEWVLNRLGTPPETPYKEWVEAVRTFPLDLVPHCSCDYSMYFAAVRGTVTTASRGYPQKLSLEMSIHLPGYMRLMRELGINTDEVGWYAFSMWC